MTSRLAAVVVGAVLGVTTTSCAVNGLAFRDDDRVDIVAPRDRAVVALPMTIRWTSHGLKPATAGGPYYAVFVDRAPIKPGQSLRSIADDACQRSAGCPDLAYFRDRYVFITEQQSVTVDVVPRRSGQRTSARNRHEATVVLIDADGRRIDESAYTVEFTVKEE